SSGIPAHVQRCRKAPATRPVSLSSFDTTSMPPCTWLVTSGADCRRHPLGANAIGVKHSLQRVEVDLTSLLPTRLSTSVNPRTDHVPAAVDRAWIPAP